MDTFFSRPGSVVKPEFFIANQGGGRNGKNAGGAVGEPGRRVWCTDSNKANTCKGVRGRAPGKFGLLREQSLWGAGWWMIF